MASSSPLNHLRRLLTRGRRFITAGAMAVVCQTSLVRSGNIWAGSLAWLWPAVRQVRPSVFTRLFHSALTDTPGSSNIRSNLTEIRILLWCLAGTINIPWLLGDTMGQMVRDMLDVISPGSPYRLKGRATQAWGPGPLLARPGRASQCFLFFHSNYRKNSSDGWPHNSGHVSLVPW